MRRRYGLVALIGLGCLSAAELSAQQGAAAAVQLLRSGSYDEAIAALDDLRTATPSASHLRWYARALAEVGEYEQALEVLDGAPAESGVALANVRGELLLATGDVDEARAAFTRGWEGGAPDAYPSRLNRAILDYDYGDRDAALAEFDTFIDLYNSATVLPARDLIAVARAVSYLGVTNKDLYQDALRAFDEAAAADPSSLEPALETGLLFLERYDGTSADTEIERVLGRNPNHARALVAKAKAMQFNGSMGVMETVEKALETNPSLVEALVFKARLHLAATDYEAAAEELEKALEINPASLEALSVRAAASFLRGDVQAFEADRDHVATIAPDYPELFNDIAELAVNHRKYREAAELAARAVEIDSRSWRGLTLLGQNQLRLGRIDEGKASLERAYEGDPYNPWVVNTLRLVDSFENFGVSETDKFVLVLHDREDDLLRTYVEEIAEDAFAALQARYAYTPPLPIRIEVYRDHADFSVRTLGLPGIGALGVSFGSVIAMDSPAAKRLGEFNWASTLWHEMAHVFHLGLTEHEVPRWFSEGLAVHEQHAARPGWGHQPSPGFLGRYKAGLFLPASKLDAGFVRPSYPEQVVDSYFLASIVFEYIEGRWGFDPILGMMHGYRDGKETEQLIEELLGVEPETFDEDFDRYFSGKFETALAALGPAEGEHGESILPQSPSQAAVEEPGRFTARMEAGLEAYELGDLDEAEEQFRAALRLFPEYGGPSSPYWYLALIHERRGELERAAQALARLNALNESNYEARLKQSEILEELGDTEGAASALESAVFIYPYEFELHERLARLHTELGQHEGRVRERKAILALDPVDRASAFYELALAQQAAGQRSEARRSVMNALEIAPSFDEALELLLELRGGGSER